MEKGKRKKNKPQLGSPGFSLTHRLRVEKKNYINIFNRRISDEGWVRQKISREFNFKVKDIINFLRTDFGNAL